MSVPTAMVSVHPHACGEHYSASSGRTVRYGSSPRMWGTRLLGQCVLTLQRFIPTHVGNTLLEGLKDRKQTVHPHACGEHASVASLDAFAFGSSPRMWGTHFFQVSDDIKFSKNTKLYRNIGALKMDSNLETSFLFFDFFRRLFWNKRNEFYAVHFFVH